MKGKDYIQISGKVFNYTITTRFYKKDLIEEFKQDKSIRSMRQMPTVNIREFMILQMLHFAHESIDEKREGFYIGF